ncbi:MAG: sodium:solute symporter [Opitutaceae bacterium]|nr:sodium:solute symporter [Cephaloticoccus sp.]MCP5530414.1 sodium:solute symporter [Opitutaceae bacterium]
MLPQPHLTSLDLVVLIGYFLAVLAVGFAFWKRSRSVDGFTVASRGLPGWLTGLSILGTYVSSISFVALPGKAFGGNWNSFVFSLSIPLAAWIAVRWFLPFYRESGTTSAYTHLEQRFGPWARIYASACYLLTQLARIGTVTYLMALPMQVLLGWNIGMIIIVTGIVTTLYTFVGGIVGVIWTDAIQTIVLMAGALACALIMVFSLPGGWGQLVELANAGDKFSLGSFGGSLTESTFWVVLIYGLFINLQNFGVDQNYVQRYHTSRSDREARKSIWMGGLLYVPLSALFFFIGTALFAYYSVHPGALPPEYRGQGDLVFPWFIVSVLPSGVTGLLVASVFAAAMSTISSSLNSTATIVLDDYYLRFVRPGADERQKMRLLHVTTAVIGVLGTVMALAMINVKSALDAWWSLAGIFSGGMLGLFLLGFISRQARSAGALTGVAAGVLIILWMSLSPRWEGELARWSSPFHGFLTIVFGTAAILLVGLLITGLFKNSEQPREGT